MGMIDSPEQIAQKLRFDAEDRLPLRYWDRVRQPAVSGVLEKSDESKNGFFKKIDPEEWLKAPVFVPRSHQTLAESFGLADAMAFPEAGCSLDYPDNSVSEYSTTSIPENRWASSGDNFTQTNTTSSLYSPPLMKIRTNPMSTQPPMNGHPPPSLYGVLPPPPPTHTPNFAHLPLSQPPFMPTTGPFHFLPRGYSANITAITPGVGHPPIPAIVLKKKRKRRPRKYKDIKQTKSFESKASSFDRHPSDPNDRQSNMTIDNSFKSPRTRSNDNIRSSSARSSRLHLLNASSEPELNSKDFETTMDDCALLSSTSKTGSNFIGGSCPDLSDDQLKIWDDILYRAVIADKEKHAMAKKLKSAADEHSIKKQIEEPEPVMQTSIYELCPPAVFDAIDMAVHAEGINSKDLRSLDKQLAGCNLEESFTEANMVDRLKRFAEKPQDNNPVLPKSLNTELEDLYFKPTISEYRYPQIGSENERFHMTTYDPKTNRIRQELYSPSDEQRVEEDYFEGMNIRVNAFDECDDLALSESECPQPSRFQMMQWAFQRQKEKYIQIQPPDRVCCSIM